MPTPTQNKRREYAKRWNQSPKGKAAKARYMRSKKGRRMAADAEKRYRRTPKGQATRKQYQQSEAGKAREKRYRQGRGKITDKRRKTRLYSKGLCPRCGKPSVPGKSRCQLHLDYAAQWKARHAV